MRLSVCTPMVFRGLPFAQAIRKTAMAGYDAVEIWKYGELDPREAEAVCREYGVELLAVCTSFFQMTDVTCREQWLENLRISCEAAKKLGVNMLITQVGQDTGAPRQEQLENIVGTLQAACPILEQSGITLVMEPLNTVTREGYFLSSSDEGFSIIRAVNHPRVKLLFDIYHQQMMGEDVLAQITGNLDLIGHIHVAGCPGRNEPWGGQWDYKAILEAVEQAGYSGVCGLEYKPLLLPEESLIQARRILL